MPILTRDYAGFGVEKPGATVYLTTKLRVRLTDPQKIPIPYGRCRIADEPDTIYECDDKGVVEIPINSRDKSSIDLEWELEDAADNDTGDRFYCHAPLYLGINSMDDASRQMRLAHLDIRGNSVEEQEALAYDLYLKGKGSGVLAIGSGYSKPDYLNIVADVHDRRRSNTSIPYHFGDKDPEAGNYGDTYDEFVAADRAEKTDPKNLPDWANLNDHERKNAIINFMHSEGWMPDEDRWQKGMWIADNFDALMKTYDIATEMFFKPPKKSDTIKVFLDNVCDKWTSLRTIWGNIMSGDGGNKGAAAQQEVGIYYRFWKKMNEQVDEDNIFPHTIGGIGPFGGVRRQGVSDNIMDDFLSAKSFLDKYPNTHYMENGFWSLYGKDEVELKKVIDYFQETPAHWHTTNIPDPYLRPLGF